MICLLICEWFQLCLWTHAFLPSFVLQFFEPLSSFSSFSLSTALFSTQLHQVQFLFVLCVFFILLFLHSFQFAFFVLMRQFIFCACCTFLFHVSKTSCSLFLDFTYFEPSLLGFHFMHVFCSPENYFPLFPSVPLFFHDLFWPQPFLSSLIVLHLILKIFTFSISCVARKIICH